MFRRIIALLALTSALFVLNACQPEAPKQDPALTMPTNPADAMAWKKYAGNVAKLYAPKDKSGRIYSIYVDHQANEEQIKQRIDQIKNQIAPGLAEGTILLYASPDSKVMADIIVGAFVEPRADALKGTSVIYLGKAEDQDRVRAAVTAWGAAFTFHEAK